MSTIPFIPESSPFTPEQRQWLNGYLAGFFSNATSPALAAAPSEAVAPRMPLLVLWGSQTGTAEGLAKRTVREAEKRGFATRAVSLEKQPVAKLAEEPNVLVITSTYGDGEPPDNAQAFWQELRKDDAPRLEKTRFSLLALGDTNYAQFCQFGKECDARLEALGAMRVLARVDCDVEYDAPAAAWIDAVLTALSGSAAPAASPAPVEASAEAPVTAAWSSKNPFSARLKTNRLLSGVGSAKEVRHIEIALEGSGLSYEVGDALGVRPANCPELVSRLLAALGSDGEEAVKLASGVEIPLRLALLQHFDLCKPSTELLHAVAERQGSGELAALLDPAQRDALRAFLAGRDVLDLLAGTSFAPLEFAALLKSLQPRLYSISSSPKAHPGEVHLTVGIVRYDAHGRGRKGVCSTFLADRCGEGGTVPVFVQRSHGFRLPEDGTKPVIMVGPGTGIAPFRAFLEERQATGAAGKNWLLFGDQRQATDFLYRDQLEGWQRDGHLARLDLAFSRDQEAKIYVQHRMLEQAAELWTWLEEGAHFYVCGDASRMAKDVDAALHCVVETAGNRSPEAAAEYVQALKSAKRYQRDVY
jgi:sulfite reductase (NADPH) flavoprotein alpha-component